MEPSDIATQAFIEELYTAAVEPNGWAAVGDALAKVLGAWTSVIWAATEGGVAMLANGGCPPEAGEPYVQYYHRLDLWTLEAIQRPKLEAVLGQDLVPHRELLRSEFYVDFARPLGICHMVGTAAPLGGNGAGMFGAGVHRPQDAPPFGENERRWLTELLPHIQRAVQLHLRVRRLEQRAHAGFAALETLPYGIVVTSATGDMVFANTAAQRLAGSGDGLILGRQGQGLRAANPAENQALRRLVHDAASGGAGGVMRLTRPSRQVPLAVLISPLPLPFNENTWGGAKLALVLIKDLADEASLTTEWLRTFYGLTQAEAEVALALFAGQDAEAIAAERGVSIATIRTQIRQILAKTGAANLRDFVRRLAGLPTVLPPELRLNHPYSIPRP